MNPLLVPWLAEIGLITWRDVKNDNRPPFPSEVLATFVIFGGFSLIPNEKVGSLMGWGIVVATLLNVFDPQNVGSSVAQRNKSKEVV